jgi:hypothetical protein
VGQEQSGLPSPLSDGIRLLVDTRYAVLLIQTLGCLIIPTATSVDVERVFSKGGLVLSHIRNALSVQSTRALLCLGAWSRMGFVKDKDILQAANLPDVKGGEAELDSDWDQIL